MQHLRLLLAIEERGSLRQAADELALTQPAVTKMLQDMEALLGVPLFERHVRGLRPTRFGATATRYAKLVFSDMAGFRDELAALESGKIGKVRVGAVMAPTPVLLAEVIRRLKRDHPLLDVSVQVDTSDVLVPLLERDQLDLVLGRVPEGWDTSLLEFDQLGEEGLAIVVCRDHPLVKRRKPSFEELATFPWIMQPLPSPMRALVDRSFADAGVTPPSSTIETAAVLMTTSLLPGSDLVAVLPASVAAFYARLDVLKVLPVPLPRKLGPYGIVTRRGRPLSASMSLLVDTLRAAAAEGLA
ncbi:LysR family transcriptional regulator [Pandoraea terrae]|uniref:LysR family transcriptional regulator n=2 Tax=Pandoraea terrae TaxID=1537710 RepID=A0A5E4RTB0_9BURK|nr:LysR family transcriptional regulator [Pandoraea terrae]